MKQWRCWKLTSESIESMKQRIAEHRLRPSIHLINFKASPCQFFLMAHQTTSMRWTSSWVDRWRWETRQILLSEFLSLCAISSTMNHETLIAGKTPEAPHRWRSPLQVLGWSHAGWTAWAGWKLKVLTASHLKTLSFFKVKFQWIELSNFSWTLETNKPATPE